MEHMALGAATRLAMAGGKVVYVIPSTDRVHDLARILEKSDTGWERVGWSYLFSSGGRIWLGTISSLLWLDLQVQHVVVDDEVRDWPASKRLDLNRFLQAFEIQPEEGGLTERWARKPRRGLSKRVPRKT